MTFDPAALIPLGRAIAKIGLPFLPSLLNDVVPFPLSLLTGPAVNAIMAALGIDPSVPDAPAQAAAKIEADPTAAKAALQPVEDQHAALAATAEAELEARLADVQDARATEVKYMQAGSKLQWAPAIVSALVVIGFYLTIVCLFFIRTDLSPNQTILLNTLLGAEIPAFAGVIWFWTGSSSGSKNKDEALISMAKAPQVVQGPGSHVSGGVAPGKSGRG